MVLREHDRCDHALAGAASAGAEAGRHCSLRRARRRVPVDRDRSVDCRPVPRVRGWGGAVGPAGRVAAVRSAGLVGHGPGVNQLLSSLPLEGSGFRLRARGEVYHLYDNLGAAPRFVFTSDVRVVADGDEAFEAIRESGFDPRSMAIVEGDGPRPLTRSAPGQVTVVSYQPNEVVVDVAAPAAGVLVYNDAFHPGWTAFVDEAARPILRANYLFKGVALDAGRHRVTFAYRPPGLRFGVWMSGIGMAFAVAILLLSRRRPADPGYRADR